MPSIIRQALIEAWEELEHHEGDAMIDGYGCIGTTPSNIRPGRRGWCGERTSDPYRARRDRQGHRAPSRSTGACRTRSWVRWSGCRRPRSASGCSASSTRGVMQVVAVTDPAMLGFGLQAMIGIAVDGDIRAVAEAPAEVDEVDYVVITAGRFDVFAEVVCTDMVPLLDLVNDRIRPIPGVRTTEVFTYLDLVQADVQLGRALVPPVRSLTSRRCPPMRRLRTR